MHPVQYVFDPGRKGFMADGGVKTDSAADDKPPYLSSDVHPSYIDGCTISLPENFHCLFHIGRNLKPSGKIIAGTAWNVTQRHFRKLPDS